MFGRINMSPNGSENMQSKLNKLKNNFSFLLTIVLLSTYIYRMACYSIPQTTYQRTDIVMFGFGDLILVLFQYPHVITLPLLLIYFLRFGNKLILVGKENVRRHFLKAGIFIVTVYLCLFFVYCITFPGGKFSLGFSERLILSNGWKSSVPFVLNILGQWLYLTVYSCLCGMLNKRLQKNWLAYSLTIGISLIDTCIRSVFQFSELKGVLPSDYLGIIRKPMSELTYEWCMPIYFGVILSLLYLWNKKQKQKKKHSKPIVWKIEININAWIFAMLGFDFLTKLCIYGVEDLFTMHYADAYMQYAVLRGTFTETIVLMVIAGAICSMHRITDKSIIDLDGYVGSVVKRTIKIGANFLIYHLLLLGICYLFSDKSAVYTGLGYGDLGTLGSLNAQNPLVYDICYAIYTAVFGMTFGMLASSFLELVSNELYVFPFVYLVYYINLFIPFGMEQSSAFHTIMYFLPYSSYCFLEFNLSIGQRLMQLLVLVLVSIAFLYVAWWKQIDISDTQEAE